MATGLNTNDGFSALANPYGFPSSTASSGIPELAQAYAAQIPQVSQAPAPQPSGKVWFSPSKREFFINGVIAAEDDDTTIEQAEQLLDRPTVGAPKGGDWLPVDQQNFSQIAENIRNPGVMKLMAKNFGIGVDQLQQLAGYGLMLAGAEETGASIAQAQQKELEKTSVYRRDFTDIESASDAGEWLAASIAQQGPNIIESIAAALVGAAAGSAAGPGFGTAAGGLVGFFGKQAFKDKLKDAAERYIQAKAKGIKPSDADIDILNKSAVVAGAGISSFLSNYATGAADIYGEMREQGIDPDDTAARVQALAGAFPYALAESTGEYLLASRIFGNALQPRAIPGATTTRQVTKGGVTTTVTGPTRTAVGLELLKRGGIGLGVGAAAEGTTELAQEALVMGLSGQDLTSDEAVKRFINSFAAGAAVGGVIGGVANLKRGKRAGEIGPTQSREISLLDSSGSSTEQKRLPPPPPGTAITPFTTPVTPMGAVTPTPLLPGAPSLLAPPAPPIEAVSKPAIMVTPEGVAYPDQMLRQTGNVPPGAPGTQGVLDVFGGTISAQELASRMEPQVTTEFPTLPAPPLGAAPGQGVLQFAPPAPSGVRFTEEAPIPNTLIAQQMQAIQRRQRDEQLIQQREQEQAAERERQMDLLAQQAKIVRDREVYEAERAAREADVMARRQARQGEPTAPAPAPAQPPTRPVPVRQPQQLPLFIQQTIAAARQRIALKRGVNRIEYEDGATYEGQLKNGVPNGDGIYTMPSGDVYIGKFKDDQYHGQGTYYYADGSTYVGQWRDGTMNGKGVFTDADGTVQDGQFEDGFFLAPPEPTPPAPKKAAPKGEALKKGKKDAVQEPSAKKVPTRGGAKAGAKVGKEVPSKGKAAGKGEGLKKGKPKQETVSPKFRGKTAISDLPAAERREVERAVDAVGDFATTGGRNTIGITEREARAVLDKYGIDVIGEAGQTFDSSDDVTMWNRVQSLVDARKFTGEVYKPAIVQYREDGSYRLLETGILIEPETTTAPTAPTEPAFTPKTMAELEAEAAAQRPLRTERAPEPTTSELVDGAINMAETTVNADDFADAASNLMFHAYVDTDTNNRAANAKARKFIEETEFTAPQRQALNDALVDEIDIKGQIELARAGEYKPVYKYLVDNNLLPRLNATTTGLTAENAAQLVRDGQLSLTNLTDKTAKDVIAANPDLVEQEANNLARGQGDSMQDNPGTKLAAAIREINLSQTQRNRPSIDAKIADIQAQWDALPDEYRDFVDETGTPLSEYFTDDVLNATVVNRKLRITKQAYTEEQVAAFEADENAEPDPELQRLEREERGRGEADWNAWNQKLRDGNFSRAEGGRITQPLPALRIRTAINKFLGKLAIMPRVYVYKDQADLKAKNPRLHQRAAESRPEGDFDSTPAVGFAFGNGEVIIFSDYVATEQQLNFVLAHETIGHFGMRGLIPAKQFDALMQKIYDDNPGIRGDIDARMAVDGLSLAEATEEYLADFAAQLDTSIIARIWNAIKGVLNKLGVQFGDETARYFVSHARKYVRNGKVGVPFQINKVFERMHDVEYGQIPANPGRFATQGNVYEANKKADLMRDALGGLPQSYDQAWEALKGAGINNLGTYERFKARFLSLANFRSLQNPGANAMETLIDEMRNRSMSIKVDMNERLRTVLNRALFGKYWGVTDEQLARLSDALYAAQRLSVNRFDVAKERGRDPLFTMVDGVLELNQAEYNRLRSTGRITFEQMRDGFDYTIETIKTNGELETETVRFEGIPNLTEDSIEWTGYEKIRDAIDDVELQLAKAHYYANIAKQDTAFSEIGELMEGKELTGDDRAMLRRALDTYTKLYTENSSVDERGTVVFDNDAMERGNEFLVMFNQAILGEATDRTDKLVAQYFTGKTADDMRNRINDFKTRFRKGDDSRFEVQNKIKQLLTNNRQNDDAELYAKRTIATGYTPLLREGNYQIRVEAVDPKTGKRVQLSEASRDQLVYSQFENESEALRYAKQVNGIFGDETYKLEAFNESTGEYGVQDVKLMAVAETVLDEVAAPPELNLNEFVNGLRHFDMVVPPKKLEQIVTALTAQNSSARNRLMRSFVPGADRDAIAAVSRHIERRASTIAKVQLRPAMAELLNLRLSRTQRLWNGDPELLERLKQNTETVAADPAATDDEKYLAQQEYTRYKYMYDTTNPKGRASKGMEFYNEASRTAAFLDGNRNVDESDFGSGKLVSGIRAFTSMIQLGGSIATGVLNVIGAYTNGLPYLASLNRKTGFGGGFGMGPAVAEFHIAAKQVGAIGMNPFSESGRAANRAEFYDQIATDPRLQEQYNLKAHEARFIAREIREGAMIPAQSNALVGTSRGRMTSGFSQKFVDGWMLTFNLTEQATRRSYGLAAYRLEYKRQKGAGATDMQAEAAARKFAVNALQLTMGEYSVLNRPPAWRSGIQSFIYMYKVFPTTSVQLLANLSRNGQIGMLAGLFLLSGLMGLPFAEDIEDIVDTLAQKLGFKQGSIRYEIAKFIDGIFPGMSPYVLGGFVRDAFPGNIASRTSLGNLFPGTGMFLSGADTTRELMDIAGPAASAISGTVKTFSDAVRAPFSDQISALGVVRESPITIARAFGDAYAYTQSGSIIDRRGYMVSDDMTIGTIVTRLLGFYPMAASDQYSMIKLSKRMTDYQRDTTTAFRSAWINAMQTGDKQRARSIEEAVDDWNKQARGTALEIRNFRTNSMRALREAQRPAGERALRSAPRAAREDVERLSNLLGN